MFYFLKKFHFKKTNLILSSMVIIVSVLALYITGSSRPVNASTSNLIANPLLTTINPLIPTQPLNWTPASWGTNTPTFSYLSSGFNDSNSLTVTMSQYSSGDAKWYFTPVTVMPNIQYSFSDDYEANVVTDVTARFTNTDGSYSYVDLGNVPAHSTWQSYKVNFVVPANATQVTIFHLINSNGSLTTDNYSLTASTTPTVSINTPANNAIVSGSNVSLSASAADIDGIAGVQFYLDGKVIGSAATSPYTLIWDSTSVANGSHSLTAVATNLNGGQTTSAAILITVNNPLPTSGNLIPNPLLTTINPLIPTQPLNWTPASWGTNTPTFSYLSSGFNDSNSLTVTMSQYSSGDAKWYFTPQPVIADTQYRFSEYYKSTTQTIIEAVFTMNDGSTIYQMIGQPAETSTWAQFSSDFSIPIGCQSMTIYHLIQSNGSLTTDDFSLVPYTPIGFNQPLLTLTFDDGYSNEYSQALPLLTQYGWSSTQYIITALINQPGYMTIAQVQAMAKDGQEIASQTVSHVNLTALSQHQLINQLAQSQATLKKWVGDTTTDFAYPYGLYNTNVINAVKNYYTEARGVEDGLNSKDNFNIYDIKVQNIFNTTTTAQVADWVKQAQQTNTWLVLVYHSVDPDTTPPIDGDIYNVTPTQLAAQLAVIKTSGIAVVDMQQALAQITPQL